MFERSLIKELRSYQVIDSLFRSPLTHYLSLLLFTYLSLSSLPFLFCHSSVSLPFLIIQILPFLFRSLISLSLCLSLPSSVSISFSFAISLFLSFFTSSHSLISLFLPPQFSSSFLCPLHSHLLSFPSSSYLYFHPHPLRVPSTSLPFFFYNNKEKFLKEKVHVLFSKAWGNKGEKNTIIP